MPSEWQLTFNKKSQGICTYVWADILACAHTHTAVGKKTTL